MALARRFPAARVVAVDRSPVLRERLLVTVAVQGAADRVDAVTGDLDAALPPVGPVDVAWASSSLHEVADPDRLLREVRAALRPGGVLAVVDLDGLPQVLPDGLEREHPGLAARCAGALAAAGWNPVPDWAPRLTAAGLEVVERRREELVSEPTETARRYADALTRAMRRGLEGRLPPEDLAALDRLLDPASPDALLHRADLRVTSRRTVWSARRP